VKQKDYKKQVLKYTISDYIAAAISWTVFFSFRKLLIENTHIFSFVNDTLKDSSFIKGIIIIPLFWLLLYYIAGEYHNIFRKSRLQELGRTIFISTLGVILIFFILILDDTIISYKNYYQSFFFLLGIHFSLTYFPRLYFTTSTIHKLQDNIIGFPTLLIGGSDKAMQLYRDLQNKPKSPGTQIVGYITINGNNSELNKYIPSLGTIDNLMETINNKKIEEIIIAIEPSEREEIQNILVKAKATNVIIKAIPGLLDILSGSVKMSSLFGVPLIELSHEAMPAWQVNVKRITDVIVSFIALIILSPVYAFLAINVKLSSKGPVFYSHYRLGRFGKPFKIYKFRSMYIDAEKDGPALSSKNDPRITSFGKFMRKMRLDEIPQFYNVLIGDMSLVGPRPERQYFVEKIIERAPHYLMLFKVRPGITSWGQVKFGYAENVDEMIERLKFDIIYLENMSLYVDLKILIYTIKTVFEGSGK